MFEKHKRLSKNAALEKKRMKAKADAKRYELKRDYIREKSREYYRKKKIKLSEAAALESKKKKAAYDSKRYKCKKDEISSKAKERYRKKEKPEKVYYEKTMAIDGISQKKAANVPCIFIRDPRQLTGQTDIIEICVDFKYSSKNDKIRRSIFEATRGSVLLEIANVVRNHLSSSFPDPILCEFMLSQVLNQVDQHCSELILEHAAKLDALNSQIFASLQSLLSKELMALQNYFSLCVIDDDVINTRLIVSSILVFVFLTKNKWAILGCGFQKLHYLYVLEESRQRLQYLGLHCWSIGKFVLEDHRLNMSECSLESSLEPHVLEHCDPRINGYYYSIGPTSHWKTTKSKSKNEGKTIVFCDKVLSFRVNRPYWWG